MRKVLIAALAMAGAVTVTVFHAGLANAGYAKSGQACSGWQADANEQCTVRSGDVVVPGKCLYYTYTGPYQDGRYWINSGVCE
jgi:hypothetical protein